MNIKKKSLFILMILLTIIAFTLIGCSGSGSDDSDGVGDNTIGATTPDDDDDITFGDSTPDDDGDDDIATNKNSPLAINLSSVNYYSRQWTFLDQTKQGGHFNYNNADNDADDFSDGWARTGDVDLFLNTGLDGNYHGGRYIVLYDGKADFSTYSPIWNGPLEMPNDAILNEGLSTEGRLVLDVEPSNMGFVLAYDNIDINDPVRNMKIVHEDYEDSFEEEIFHPQFIESIKKFSTLRFMDLMRTNHSEQSLWANRPLTTDALQGTEKGVALEYLIALANKTSANPWFNIPHLATDDYVENFATMVRDRLDQDLQVYIEYSNEVWNSGFGQYAYAENQGELAGLGSNRDAADRFYCRRSVEIFKIFETVFANTNRQGLVKVIASQNSPWWAIKMMNWVDPETGERAIEQADYWAVAPYFCGDPELTSNPGSVSELLDECEADIDVTLSKAAEIGTASRSYGVELIAYEGGQHIRNDDASTEAQNIYNLANDDPRMGEVYTTYLNKWRNEVGGQTFALFSLISGQSKYGRWGILVDQDDFEYPKYQAAMEFINDNPRWW